jgi:ATP-dependent Clp protease protease subunit
MNNEKSRKKQTDNDGIGNFMLPGLDDDYFNQPVIFRDCDDHYELIYTGEFEDVGRDSIAVTKLIQDLKDGNKDTELHILINSIGGSVDNLSFVLQQVLQYRHRVTVCCGSALSAGFILWACGNERYVSPYSELMYHTIYSGYEGKGTELASYGAHVERLTDELMDAVDMKSLISEEDMQKGKSTEVWYLGKDFIDSGKAKDYSEYAMRQIPVSALITIAGDRFFAKSGEKYIELTVASDREYEYGEILEINKTHVDDGMPVISIETQEEQSSSSSSKDDDDKKKTKKRAKKHKKQKLTV